jgi:ankyrin repeat protein
MKQTIDTQPQKEVHHTADISAVALSNTAPLTTALPPAPKYLVSTDITKTAEKTKGTLKGFIGKTPEKTKKTGDKVQYTWMVKEPGDRKNPNKQLTHKDLEENNRENISEILASALIRYFLKDNAAKVKPVADKGQVIIASRFIESFKDLEDLNKADSSIFTQHGTAKDYKDRQNIAINHFPKMKRTFAVNFLIGNADLNNDNLGAIIKGNQLEAAAIDFGRALLFNSTSHDCLSDTHDSRFPANKYLVENTPYTAADSIRVSHNGHYKYDRSIFIDKEFASEIDIIVKEYEAAPHELNSIAVKTVQSIIDAYKAAKGPDFDLSTVALPNIDKDANLGNLKEKIVSALPQRIQQMKDVSLSIKIQLAIKGSKSFKEIKAITDAAGYNKDTKLAFLPIDSSEDAIRPPMTIGIYTGLDKKFLKAIKEDNLEKATKLINLGANVDFLYSNGDTPLIVSTSNGQDKIVELLLKNGANPYIQANDGSTALGLAAEEGHQNIFDTLRKRLYKDLFISLQNKNFEYTTKLIGFGANINIQDIDGDTMLIAATRQGNHKIAKFLLEQGADPYIQATDGSTALKIAANEGHADIAYILKRKLNKDLLISLKNKNFEDATKLIGLGADVNAKDSYGNTMLISAARKGKHKIVEFLLEQGANPYIQAKDGSTALTIASNHGNLEIMEAIINNEHKNRAKVKDMQNPKQVLGSFTAVVVNKMLQQTQNQPTQKIRLG